jgi:hypothetical protein
MGPVGLAAAAWGAWALRPVEDRFRHEKHAKVFPLCSTCHAGMAEAGSPVWPEPASCEACHDGVTKDRIDWTPRAGPRITNVKFDHLGHTRAATTKRPADSTRVRDCGSCHNESGAPRMRVQHAVSGQCVDCHQPSAVHLALADTACATCHLPLSEARLLPRATIAAFPEPDSHRREGFVLGGHGKLAEVPLAGGRVAVAASCATCHARDFCITCHVNTPEVAVIQALAPDARSLVHEAELPVPPDHARRSFLRDHSREAVGGGATCSTCHTQASCTACHTGRQPRAVVSLASPGPGRANGAQIARAKPETHTAEFTDRHGPDANARPATCEGCHVRPDCLDCHRPGPDGGSGHHPPGFLVRHPASAYARDATCADCHNPAQFCQSCHQQAGFRADGRLGGAGFHDGARAFLVGHGQAARQSLESCASCHAERDCTACHAAIGGGFRFSPHGPGFNPDRMRRKNPSTCVACHGTGIPGGGR